MHPDSLILFGGGLDSATMVEMDIHTGETPVLVHFNYGQKALAGERAALQYFAAKYSLNTWQVSIPASLFPDSPLINAPRANLHDQNYLPGRNMVFAALAFPVAVRLQIPRIKLGASPAEASSVYLDAKPEFGEAFNKLVEVGYGKGNPKLVMPLLQLERIKYLRMALKFEPQLFNVTFSCYESSTEDECGHCTHCRIKTELKQQLME